VIVECGEIWERKCKERRMKKTREEKESYWKFGFNRSSEKV